MKIGIHGASGKVGKELVSAICNETKYELSYAYARNSAQNSLDDLCKASDIVIDFSLPEALDNLLPVIANYKTKLVSGTTGMNENQFKKLAELANNKPVLYAPNVSLGANLMAYLSKIASIKLGEQFSVTINETHHKHKKDKPSGTALMIGKSTCRKDIEYFSKREGEIFGEHEIIFESEGEIIKIYHEAKSRKLFAEGAIKACEWIYGISKSGLYSFEDILNDETI